jgi:hypothetical protein
MRKGYCKSGFYADTRLLLLVFVVGFGCGLGGIGITFGAGSPAPGCGLGVSRIGLIFWSSLIRRHTDFAFAEKQDFLIDVPNFSGR